MAVSMGEVSMEKEFERNVVERIGVMILSGGEGRRMGGLDKGWCLYENQPMIKQVLNALSQQCESVFGDNSAPIFISANRNLSDYLDLGHPVVVDRRSGFWGPLSGMESVMMRENALMELRVEDIPQVKRWITYPVDSPQVPQDYVAKMADVRGNKIGVWQAGGRSHFASLSLPSIVLPALTKYLDEGKRSIKDFLSLFSEHEILCEKTSGIVGHGQTFLNVNTQNDLLNFYKKS